VEGRKENRQTMKTRGFTGDIAPDLRSAFVIGGNSTEIDPKTNNNDLKRGTYTALGDAAKAAECPFIPPTQMGTDQKWNEHLTIHALQCLRAAPRMTKVNYQQIIYLLNLTITRFHFTAVLGSP
jgi:hypothetical protein